MTDTTPATETAVVPTQHLAEVRLLLTKLKNEVEFAADQPGTTAAWQIMESMLAAENEEELFDRQEAGAIASKDFTLRPFRLQEGDIQWKKSSQGFVEQGAFPFYALLHVTDMESGDHVVIDSGSPSVIGVLSKLIDLKGFERFEADGGRPFQFVAKPVSSGYSVILLKPVATATAPAASGKKRS